MRFEASRPRRTRVQRERGWSVDPTFRHCSLLIVILDVRSMIRLRLQDCKRERRRRRVARVNRF
jgi:hypothetical protein